MAKKQDFMSKTMKKTKHGRACPTCGEIYAHAKTVSVIPNEGGGSYRFQEKTVDICKCNEKEVYPS